MKRLLFLPLLALPLLFVSCDGEPTAPVNPAIAPELDVVTQSAPATDYVLTKFRCKKDVVGNVALEIWHGIPDGGGTRIHTGTLSCTAATSTRTQVYGLGSVDPLTFVRVRFTLQKGTMIHCPDATSWFQGTVPFRGAKCPGNNPTWGTFTARFVKPPR